MESAFFRNVGSMHLASLVGLVLPVANRRCLPLREPAPVAATAGPVSDQISHTAEQTDPSVRSPAATFTSYTYQASDLDALQSVGYLTGTRRPTSNSLFISAKKAIQCRPLIPCS
jgi:hypothetical protein